MGSPALSVVHERCERCDCGDTRRTFLTDAIIAAARSFVAQVMTTERREHQAVVWPEHGEAYETLVDALRAERQGRRG